MSKQHVVVTGAFGYMGQYITRLLLAQGHRVTTLTAHPDRPSDLRGRIRVAPFDFDRSDLLARSLQGATAVINTYWVRFDHGATTYQKAIENTKALISASADAGVGRFVHISITNASEDSQLPYFRSKAILERAVIESGLSYAIIRPTVIFGLEDILINNIAWLLRRFPVFVVPGSGDYRLQPVFVEDIAQVVVGAAQEAANSVIDAAGPEVFSFNELIDLLATTVGSRARRIHVSPQLALTFSRLIGWLMRDVTLTRDEVRGLMANLLVSKSRPLGRTPLSRWLQQNAATVGIAYASELARRRL